jgi:hypothetical protein
LSIFVFENAFECKLKLLIISKQVTYPITSPQTVKLLIEFSSMNFASKIGSGIIAFIPNKMFAKIGKIGYETNLIGERDSET